MILNPKSKAFISVPQYINTICLVQIHLKFFKIFTQTKIHYKHHNDKYQLLNYSH